MLPGTEDAALADIRRIVGDEVEVQIVHQDIGLEVPFGGDLVEAMVAALGRHDPGIPVIPYLLGGGTDNKALAYLGIAGYGFAPLRLPADLDFTGMFHGVDERVPTRRARLRPARADRPAANLLTEADAGAPGIRNLPCTVACD